MNAMMMNGMTLMVEALGLHLVAVMMTDDGMTEEEGRAYHHQVRVMIVMMVMMAMMAMTVMTVMMVMMVGMMRVMTAAEHYWTIMVHLLMIMMDLPTYHLHWPDMAPMTMTRLLMLRERRMRRRKRMKMMVDMMVMWCWCFCDLASNLFWVLLG
jgi:hypothetical protein